MLDVYFNEKLAGHLTQGDDGQKLFKYSQRWLDDIKAVPRSQTLALREPPFIQKDFEGFFKGVLPERDKREVIAGILGISANDDYSMLEKLGGECPGAISFRRAGIPFQAGRLEYRQLGESELATVLRALPRRPLMAGDQGVRHSLAGGQDKMAVHVSGNVLSVPLEEAPSTHILKPGIGEFEGIVFNEAVCMTLADQVGLDVAPVKIGKAEEIDYLMVQRFDRKIDSEGRVQRMHQEDFCQALGIVPERKYQNEGGPTLQQCFNLLRAVSAIPVLDLQRFLNAIIFHVLIGNHDAHAKNFALKYGRDATIRLAPMYDIISTVYYPELSQQLAMEIGGESRSDHLGPSHFERLAKEAGLAKPMVVRRVPELARRILTHLKDISIRHNVACLVLAKIKKRCEAFLQRFKK